jgi:DnaD/phage-associated family protein
VSLSQSQVRKLLSASSPDAALLYIYLSSGNRPENAQEELRLSEARISCALAVLRQLGLWTDEKQSRIVAGERPSYSETDVLRAMDDDRSFRSLYEEIQRLLGRSLNTEELKILLGFVRYLGMSPDVIHMLVCYCRERARQKGSHRNPSLRTIEKEAYFWAEQGIDSVEEAAAFIQTQSVRTSRMSRLMKILQIHGRNLTAAEERYAAAWLEMGFEDSALAEAYERTCLNTGSLNWPYMNKILQRWHEAGLHTAEAVKNGDRKPGQTQRNGQRQLDEDERAAIERMLSEV